MPFTARTHIVPQQHRRSFHLSSSQRTKAGAVELAALIKAWPSKQKAELDDAIASKVRHAGPTGQPQHCMQVDTTLATYHDSSEQTMAGAGTPGADPHLDKVDASHALQAMAWLLKLIVEHATQQLSQPLRSAIVSLHDNALLVRHPCLNVRSCARRSRRRARTLTCKST